MEHLSVYGLRGPYRTIDLHSLTSVGATGTQSLLFDALPKLTALDVRAVAETPTGGGVALTTLGATASGDLIANFASIGRDIRSFNDLTREDAGRLLEALDALDVEPADDTGGGA